MWSFHISTSPFAKLDGGQQASCFDSLDIKPAAPSSPVDPVTYTVYRAKEWDFLHKKSSNRPDRIHAYLFAKVLSEISFLSFLPDVHLLKRCIV